MEAHIIIAQARPKLVVNLDAIVNNYKTLSGLVPRAKTAAVVKCNAYGLGVDKVVPPLLKIGCRMFCVAYPHEGVEVRKIAPEAEIFVLHGVWDDTVYLFSEYSLIPVISSLRQLSLWEEHGDVSIHPVLHIDSGLNRFGLRENDVSELGENLGRLQKTGINMHMSHLACADAESHFMNAYQRGNFDKLKAMLPDAPAMLSASDGAFLSEIHHYDVVRLGAAMYGLNTARDRKHKMQPVIHVTAPVVQVAELKKGQHVGYGATYQAAIDRKLAVISIGYGDGLPRCLGNHAGKICFSDAGYVQDGVSDAHFDENAKTYYAPIIGRISMDLITCDITDIPDGIVREGTVASLINSTYTCDDIGADAGTIGYEILTSLGQRYERKFIGG